MPIDRPTAFGSPGRRARPFQGRPQYGVTQRQSLPETHEWHKTEGGGPVLGLTRFASTPLPTSPFVEMKPAGTSSRAAAIGTVESVKTTSDVYCLVPGEVTEVNAALGDHPELLNSDPYGQGWLVKIRPGDAAGLAKAMNATAYDAAHPA